MEEFSLLVHVLDQDRADARSTVREVEAIDGKSPPVDAAFPSHVPLLALDHDPSENPVDHSSSSTCDSVHSSSKRSNRPENGERDHRR